MRFRKLITLILSVASLVVAQPITGEADNLEFKKDRIIYEGNVKLIRGESVLKADKVIIFLDENNKPLKMVATGRVVYIEPKRRAVSEYVEYDFREETILLRGNAKVEEDKNVLEADEILYDKKKDSLKAKGDKSRVRTIYIEEEKE